MVSDTAHRSSAIFEPGRIITFALYLYFVAIVVRTLVWFMAGNLYLPQFPWVMGMEFLFILLYSLVLWWLKLPPFWLHIYLFFQSVLVLSILLLTPALDFSTGLYLILSSQIALFTRGRTRQGWILWLEILIVLPAVFFGNPLRHLALQLSTMAGIVVLAAYIATMQEEESARALSQVMLAELQDTHQKLKDYAGQAEDLAAIEERNRLARELHDSVSQTIFSIILNVRAAQMLLDRDPARLRTRLETLQALTQSALGEMRRLIAELRPK
jgi:signal transduction histidine kinase